MKGTKWHQKNLKKESYKMYVNTQISNMDKNLSKWIKRVLSLNWHKKGMEKYFLILFFDPISRNFIVNFKCHPIYWTYQEVLYKLSIVRTLVRLFGFVAQWCNMVMPKIWRARFSKKEFPAGNARNLLEKSVILDFLEISPLVSLTPKPAQIVSPILSADKKFLK